MFSDHLVKYGPVASAGSASGSAWMQEEDFLAFLQHLAKHMHDPGVKGVAHPGQPHLTSAAADL